MTEDPVADKDGIYEDSDAGTEQATITTTDEEPKSEDVRIGELDPNTKGGAEVLSTTQSSTRIFFSRPPSDGSLEWLRRVWLACGGVKRKDEFDVFADDWKGELGYPALLKLLKGAEAKGYLAAIPSSTQPDIVTHVKLFPGCLRTLEEMTEQKQASRQKPGPKTSTRQVTAIQEDGARIKYDTRIGRVFNILHADSEVLADVAYGDLNQFRNTQNKRVRRRLKAEVRDMMMLRGKDLPRDLYGSVCLRLGMPLPSDFWHISPERLPNYTGDV